ncbi:MAG: FAD-binding domain-containing protein, partial [Luminiphilus sp.]|nr:FAD-binding domain-containing protein [Luminiphilus sp.]
LLSPMERQLHPIDYPEPIVDLKESYPFARDALWQLKSDHGVRREKARILDQHVERRSAR